MSPGQIYEATIDTSLAEAHNSGLFRRPMGGRLAGAADKASVLESRKLVEEPRLELFGFGPHLMIDGYHANAEKLGDFELVRQVLEELPEEMEMTKVLPPIVQRYPAQPCHAEGVTGVVLIAESHIAIHTFPSQRFISVDIFSCKEFDLGRAVKSVVERFEIGRYETYLINRGKEYPKDIELARQIVAGEREYLEARIG